MAVPKGKVSRQRRDKACGQYKGRTVINVEESK